MNCMVLDVVLVIIILYPDLHDLSLIVNIGLLLTIVPNHSPIIIIIISIMYYTKSHLVVR